MNQQNIGCVSWKTMWTLAAASVLVVAAGCGGGVGLPEGETGTVSGKITFDGKPIPAGSLVTFANEKHGFIATGTVAADGTYSLQMRGGPDILAGAYRVAVTPPTSAQPEMSQAEYDKMMTEGGKPPEPKKVSEIPKKYQAPEGSGLTYEVKAGENTGADFELTKE